MRRELDTGRYGDVDDVVFVQGAVPRPGAMNREGSSSTVALAG
jgi:hypothetical protein